MVLRLSVVVLLAAVLGACGPHYSVYDGGLSRQSEEKLSDARKLLPTETGVVFRTDYAPPEENASYGGPTNRVQVKVPLHQEDMLVSLKTSSGPQVVRVASPAGSASASTHLGSKLDSKSAQLLSGPEGTNTVGTSEQSVALISPDSLSGEPVVTGATAKSDMGAVQTASGADALSENRNEAAAVGIMGTDALRGTEVAGAAMGAGTVEGASVFNGRGVGRVVEGADAAGSLTGTVVAKARVDTGIVKDVGVAGQPIGAETVTGGGEFRAGEAAAGRTTSEAAGVKEDIDAANLLVERDTMRDFWNSFTTVGTTVTEGALAYEGRDLKGVFAETSALATTRAAGNLREGRLEKSAADLGTSAATREVRAETSVLEARGAEGLSEQFNTISVRTDTGTIVVKNIAATSPPQLSVIEQGKLVKGRELEKLIEDGVIKEKPEGGFVIRYRIAVLNDGESIAKDVRVLDRLDANYKLVGSAASKEVRLIYDPETSALEVSVSSMEPGSGFLLELYAAPIE